MSLTSFPDLLTYTFFAPTILRLVAAGMFVYLTTVQYRNRGAITKIHYPVVRGQAVLWLALIVNILVAAALLFGYHTQYAALIGSIVAFFGLFGSRHEEDALFPLPKSTAVLLLCILLSLLLTGAGAFALDYPL